MAADPDGVAAVGAGGTVGDTAPDAPGGADGEAAAVGAVVAVVAPRHACAAGPSTTNPLTSPTVRKKFLRDIQPIRPTST
ncbi:MAG TPA: hypothetical protein VIN09_12030, partial [Chloroflexota bacterium]